MHKCHLYQYMPLWLACDPWVPKKGQFCSSDFGDYVEPGSFQWSIQFVKFTKLAATMPSLHLMPNFDSNGSGWQFAYYSTTHKMAISNFYPLMTNCQGRVLIC